MLFYNLVFGGKSARNAISTGACDLDMHCSGHGMLLQLTYRIGFVTEMALDVFSQDVTLWKLLGKWHTETVGLPSGLADSKLGQLHSDDEEAWTSTPWERVGEGMNSA
jgi:hypothetical protein